MPRHYVTFGQIHTHRINNITIDCDCVVEYGAENAIEGRKKAFEYFSDKFFTDYHDKAFNEENLKYFPRGIINIEQVV